MVFAVGAIAVLGGAYAYLGSEPAPQPRLHPEEIDAAAHTKTELEHKMRDAFLSGKPVRVEFRPDDGEPVKTLDYWSRSLTEEDVYRAKRMIAGIRRGTDKGMFYNESSDEVRNEVVRTTSLRTRALIDAAELLIDEGKAFITRGPVLALKNSDRWHYWNLGYDTKAEGHGLVLYVPIDLDVHPHIRSLRRRSDEVREFSVMNAAYEWNSLDYDERKSIVDAAKAAQVRYDEIAPLEEELRGRQESLTDEERSRLRALWAEIGALQDTVSKAPRSYHPVTLEWQPR